MKLTDKEYKYVYDRVPRLCVDIIIREGDKFFLIKRETKPHKGKLHLPGGRVQKGEKLSEAIKRISIREIGFPVKPVRMIGYMEFLSEHSVSLAFECSTKFKLDCLPLVGNIHPIHLKFLKSL